MDRLTDVVLRHRRLVAAFWLVATAASLFFVGRATGALSGDNSLPGRDGFETNQRILATYGTGGGEASAPEVLVVQVPEGRRADSPQVTAEMGRLLERVTKAVPDVRTASFGTTRDTDFVATDGRTTFALVFVSGSGGGIDAGEEARVEVRDAVRDQQVAGAPVLVTGLAALRAGDSGGGGDSSALVETLIGAVGALAVLSFVFASLLAFVPLLMALAAIPVTFMLVWAITTVTDVSFVVTFLVALVGLGVAIDYALLVVMRWREERDRGEDNETAVRTAMRTAGTSVVFSGSTVAIGLVALVALPVPFLRSVGYGGALIPLVSVLVAVTFLPVVLVSVGPALDRHRLRRGDGQRFWSGWAAGVVRRRWPATIAAVLVLGALAAAATTIRMGDPVADALAAGGDAERGLRTLETSGLGPGVIAPFEALVGSGSPERVAESLGAVAGVRGAIAPDGEAWRQAGTAIVDVFPADDGSSSAGKATLERVREAAEGLPGDVDIGGLAAENADFIDAVYGSFPLMILLISVVSLVLLARAFSSVVLAVKAVLLNLLSVAAAWGFLVLFWQRGYGSDEIFDVTATGSITAFVPLMVFAFLYGISMDYEVFVVARIREEYDHTGSTSRAIAAGIGSTGRLVTSAALILFLAFVALASTPETDIRIFATALAVGVALDAVIVRMLLVPGVLALLGRWNWWMPAPVARVLRVPPHAPPPASAAEPHGQYAGAAPRR